MQIHSGPNAIRILQRIIGVKDDGIIGPITLNALASRPVSLNEYADGRIKFYNSIVENNPDKKEFIKGWRARANSYRK
jgi:lysozyme family protein